MQDRSTANMSRPFNCPHPERAGRHTYSKRKKSVIADKYGYYENGEQKAVDKIAGKTSRQSRDISQLMNTGKVRK